MTRNMIGRSWTLWTRGKGNVGISMVSAATNVSGVAMDLDLMSDLAYFGDDLVEMQFGQGIPLFHDESEFDHETRPI